VHYNASASVMDCPKALLTSPVVLLCLENFIERWVSACIHEAIELSINRPENPDISSRDVIDRDGVLEELGLRRESPPLIRNAISRILVLLGWAPRPGPHDTARPRSIEVVGALDPSEGQAIEVGSTRVTNVSQLNLPVVQTQDPLIAEPAEPDVITTAIDAVDEMLRSTTPPTTPGSGLDYDENDPRIRITSREGVVEMEVRLPLATRTELVDAVGPSSEHIATASRNRPRSSQDSPYHRVSRLSCEPAQMISEIVRSQLVRLAMLPIRMVTLRMVASYYLATQGRYVVTHRIVSPLGLSNNFSWSTIGIQFSRVALCGALELAIDLGLWGLHYCTITKLGTSLFEWGTL
jgi:hypothetical protein